ncbi:MAG: hypothetical protein VR73_15105 [Gammaproteobacteria bacterium BRH_c0]|nr:MAG: hypothetical protein VR73_15105 [Gammaproteobacteria bacterium BRH_c0]
MSKQAFKPLASAAGAAFVASLAMSSLALAAENPFQASELSSGYQVAQAEKDGEGKCGEGKCGEGKCGEGMGAEGDAKAACEGKCGEGKCGEEKCSEHGDKARGEGKCGEGKCGADEANASPADHSGH